MTRAAMIIASFVETSPLRSAVMLRASGGKFVKFKKGERVMVRYVKASGTFTVEKLKWKQPVPLCNSLCGVPRNALKIER